MDGVDETPLYDKRIVAYDEGSTYIGVNICYFPVGIVLMLWTLKSVKTPFLADLQKSSNLGCMYCFFIVEKIAAEKCLLQIATKT